MINVHSCADVVNGIQQNQVYRWWDILRVKVEKTITVATLQMNDSSKRNV